jgi:hypothetical protein
MLKYFEKQMNFCDEIIDFFEKNNNILSIINKTNINNFQSKIIKEYEEVSNGSDDYFEDKVMNVFDEYYCRDENEDAYDDICTKIILIYYRSITGLNNYYCDIYKKKKFYL